MTPLSGSAAFSARHHPHRRPRTGPRLNRHAAARRSRRPRPARQGVRPRGRSRRRARRLPGHGHPWSPQSPRPAL